MEELDPNALAPTGVHHQWLGTPEKNRDSRVKDYSAEQIDKYVRNRYIRAPLVSAIFAEELDETLDEWDDRDEELTWGQVIREAVEEFAEDLFELGN